MDSSLGIQPLRLAASWSRVMSCPFRPRPQDEARPGLFILSFFLCKAESVPSVNAVCFHEVEAVLGACAWQASNVDVMCGLVVV